MATIRLPPDFREFLSLLNSTGVRYLLVGGYAVAVYGHPRATGDLDLWVADDAANCDQLRRCLVDFGFTASSLPTPLFAPPQTTLRMGLPPMRIELLSQLSGVQFTECFPRRQVIDLDGVPTNTISLADLIANKRAAKRPRDLADLQELQPPPT
jgi:predicted nucleotidyltransferase